LKHFYFRFTYSFNNYYHTQVVVNAPVLVSVKDSYEWVLSISLAECTVAKVSVGLMLLLGACQLGRKGSQARSYCA